MHRSENYIIYRMSASEKAADIARAFLQDEDKAWIIEEANPRARFRAGESIVIPLKYKNNAGLAADGYQTIPILTYHRFARNCESPLCVPASVFDGQMKYLSGEGYQVIGPEDLFSFMANRQGLPKKSVMITMDDGYRSAYEIAYPILRKYGFTATLFVYTDFVGVSKMAVTWDQLREMKAAGFTIGSHTIYHSDLTTPKEGESEADFKTRVYQEVVDSKKILDRKLKQNTYFLAYPFGRYDQQVISISKQAGYKLAVSVNRGGNPFFTNPFAIKRDQILKRDISSFINRLNTFTPLSLR
ncbi:MAG: polysaccharide deacetylase family protein [Desulfobacteraceae bacterium]|nr:polysaccharide deacetylase family protein [Desulfobacteraceae bacterium]